MKQLEVVGIGVAQLSGRADHVRPRTTEGAADDLDEERREDDGLGRVKCDVGRSIVVSQTGNAVHGAARDHEHGLGHEARALRRTRESWMPRVERGVAEESRERHVEAGERRRSKGRSSHQSEVAPRDEDAGRIPVLCEQRWRRSATAQTQREGERTDPRPAHALASRSTARRRP